MRLGGYFRASSIEDLEPLCEKLDCYGLSTIAAPSTLETMDDDVCAAFGEKARGLGIVIGEIGMWENLMTDNADLRRQRVEKVRGLLRKADIMGCLCVVSLVGTKDGSGHPLAPHPYMYTEACKKEFRELVLKILDGLDLRVTRYASRGTTPSFTNLREFAVFSIPSIILSADFTLTR